MPTVYGTSTSGNCHKAKMVFEVTRQPYAWHEIDLMKGETRTPEFLRLNPNGQVPVLVLDDGSTLAESNAILWYVGEETELVPAERLQRARMLQWMFFEQYTHEPAIAVARFIRVFLKRTDDARLPELVRRGDKALAIMERHLADRAYFAGDRLSLADLSLYAYTHKAADGGFDLGAYPAVSAWVTRCQTQRGLTVMPSP